jgi:hypothetical protein
MPELEPIVIEEVALLQVPPGVASLKVDTPPAHMLYAPRILDGLGLTVTVAVAPQPLAVYVMIAVPGILPVISPVVVVNVAAVAFVLELLQVPPEVALVRVVVAPGQTVSTPVGGDGTGTTVTTRVAEQPVPTA